MRRWIVVCSLIVVFTISGTAQTVNVPQAFIDQADKAFQEVVADRAVIEAKNQAIAAKDALVSALLDKNKLLEAQNAELSKLKCSKTKFLWGIVSATRCH